MFSFAQCGRWRHHEVGGTDAKKIVKPREFFGEGRVFRLFGSTRQQQISPQCSFESRKERLCTTILLAYAQSCHSA